MKRLPRARLDPGLSRWLGDRAAREGGQRRGAVALFRSRRAARRAGCSFPAFLGGEELPFAAISATARELERLAGDRAVLALVADARFRGWREVAPAPTQALHRVADRYRRALPRSLTGDG